MRCDLDDQSPPIFHRLLLVGAALLTAAGLLSACARGSPGPTLVMASPPLSPTSPPTSTPTPHPTTVPLPTSTPTANPEIHATVVSFRLDVAKIMAGVGAGMSELARLTGEAEKNPSLIVDSGWKQKVAVEAEVIHSAHRQLSALAPPPELAYAYSVLLSATQDCSDAMYSLSDGIESQDIQKFNEARALAMSCQAKLDQTQTLLDAYDVARLATPTP